MPDRYPGCAARPWASLLDPVGVSLMHFTARRACKAHLAHGGASVAETGREGAIKRRQLNGTGLIIGGIFTRPSSRPQGRFQSEPFGCLAEPVVLTVGLPPSDTSSNCLERCFRLWRIDQINPVARARQWPLAKPTPIVGRSIDPTPETRPSPLFRTLDQIGPQGVPLVREQAIRADAHRARFQCPLDRPFECLEVSVLQKQPHPSHTTVPHVEDHPSRSISRRARRANSLRLLTRRVNIGPGPFNCLFRLGTA